MSRVRVILVLSLVTTVTAVSCKHEKTDPTTRPVSPRVATWEQSRIPIDQGSVTVAEGRTPLFHLFDVGGRIRVNDTRTGRQLMAMDVRARTVVRIDDRNGVVVGGQVIVPGPLPPGGVYAIILDPTTPNTFRQGTGPPGTVTPR